MIKHQVIVLTKRNIYVDDDNELKCGEICPFKSQTPKGTPYCYLVEPEVIRNNDRTIICIGSDHGVL